MVTLGTSARVVKVEAEGLTTSFRYPFFMWGRQPTFEMPPPATIYGHICSAVGDLLDPRGLRFGYWFAYEFRGEDLEHLHAINRGGGTFSWRGQKVPKNLDAQVQPLRREFLLHPRLVLYLNRPDLLAAFESPHYAVGLGRSQDLFTYTRVSTVDLIEATQAYVEHTLLPGALGSQVDAGIAVSMPRFVDYDHDRAPAFGQYVMVQNRQWPRNNGPFLVDPDTTEVNGCKRAVIMHGFVD